MSISDVLIIGLGLLDESRGGWTMRIGGLRRRE
jgi:hypothetical protein